MLPVDFEGANITMEKPSDWTDEQCGALRAYKDVDEDGIPFFVECWQPSKEDIEAIAAGRQIFIKICSHGLPPIAMWTLNEKGEGNF